MREEDKILKHYLHGSDGKQISQVYVYGTLTDTRRMTADPAFIRVKIIPCHPMEEGGRPYGAQNHHLSTQ